MKKFCIIVFLFAAFTAKTQTPSDCSIPGELSTYYERDIKNMALRRMDQLQSPDIQLIRIPSSWQDTIARGLAAILQSGLPEADSVFNRYCVHDNTSPMQIYQGLLIQVDLAYPWTQAWQNLNTITGNPYIDTLQQDTTYSSFNSSTGALQIMPCSTPIPSGMFIPLSIA